MPGLASTDLKLIAQFVEHPRHRRRPEMLCPPADGADPRPGGDGDGGAGETSAGE